MPSASQSSSLEHSMAPTRTRWGKDEEARLLHAVPKHSAGGVVDWKAVIAEVQTRDHRQCHEKWTNGLDPALVKGLMEPYEQGLLCAGVAVLGRRWKTIQEILLPHRAANTLKNWWCVPPRRAPVASGSADY